MLWTWTIGYRFLLRDLGNPAEHFTAAGLVESCIDSRFPDSLKQANCAERRYVTCVFRDIEADSDVTLSGQIVDFVGFDLRYDLDEVG